MTRTRALLWLLTQFILVQCAIAGDELAYGAGPWHLGMTAQDVKAIANFGPYTNRETTGEIETDHASFVGDGRHTTFGFDGGKLSYVEVRVYQGADLHQAKAAAIGIFNIFTDRYGGAEILHLDLNDKPVFDRSGMDVFMESVWGKSRKVAREIDEKAIKDGKKGIVSTFAFDMVPVRQPLGCRLHSQLGYSSVSDRFTVVYFEDAPSNPSREAHTNVHTDYVK